ncbi:hydantoinase B/oxoprolinase family protein [Halovivax gelatinilyticus]|uniref:hydantoinase B/oxoprolinase family protein n=1 Tax=Halovivax gelatinilyticus TaxID=2961597 RepID=UPI0020CA8403|nr:hydantoinase B/oxoprolinase family protein [Halovivax gelatinilyticus]
MVSGDELEIFRHELQGIVEEMGVTLERTSYSTNIKIRRDYSCALFDADCRHIAQFTAAPSQVAALLYATPAIMEERKGDLEPGDGFLLNDPAQGGAVHLPDVMLISPVFHDGEVIGFVGNDAHHVDIGGETPGGIPSDSTSLYGEGLIMPGMKAVRGWEYDEEMLRVLTRNVRGAKQRVGDYHAQLGANQIGSRRYTEVFEAYQREALGAHIDELLEYTEQRVRAEIDRLPDGHYHATDYLDGDGIVDEPVKLELEVRIDGDELTFDFTGTADQNRGPLNSNPSTVFAAVMMAIRSLFEEDLPQNEGFYRPFELITPEGSMVNPDENAPIAATGEVTQRVPDLVIKCLSEAIPDRVIAATKGTVVNVAYGGTDPRDGESYVYYETFAGGYGARPTKDGMDAVQPHLQNTANSPIEEIEGEIPMYVRAYELRQDSEGAGRFRGGLGVRRDMEFYDHESSFTVLSDRSKFAPWGLFGGEDAKPARYVIDPDTGEEREVGSKSTTRLDAGQVASIQTPGGGGYGSPLERDPELVLQDVIDEKVSVEKARDVYGVVVDRSNREIDLEETERLRSERRGDAEGSEANGSEPTTARPGASARDDRAGDGTAARSGGGGQ